MKYTWRPPSVKPPAPPRERRRGGIAVGVARVRRRQTAQPSTLPALGTAHVAQRGCPRQWELWQTKVLGADHTP